MSNARILRSQRIAQSVIEELGITKPDQIELELIGICRGVMSHEVAFSGAEARLITSATKDNAIATINSRIPEEGRKRFALAHELGHFELHREEATDWNCTDSDFIRLHKNEDSEVEANVFAAELLMPEKMFHVECAGMDPSFVSIVKLAEIFRTSLSSTAFRYASIGNHPCALICTKDSELAWFNRSDDFPYKLYTIRSKVRSETGAGEFFSKGIDPPISAEETLKEFWLDGDGPDSLFESSIAIGRYNTVLTMIWEP